MSKSAHDRQETPDKTTQASFGGDATGAVGGRAAASVAPDTLRHDPQSPNAHMHDPGMPAHAVEDAGWVKEGQGSALAQEREGVPEGEIPHNLPESAVQPRRKA